LQAIGKGVVKGRTNFRKLYLRGSFWNGYKHHQGFGAGQAAALKYIKNQVAHHGIKVVQDIAAL
jgi:hypothetical protein